MNKLYKTHHKRLRFTLFIMVSFMFFAFSKTLYIQIFKKEETVINQQKEIRGDRGIIFDRNGEKLAYDIEVCDIYLEGIKKNQFNSLKYFFRKHFNVEVKDFEELIASSKSKDRIMLISAFPYKKIMELDYILKDHPEIKVSKKYKGRYYPKKNIASQLIGKFSHNKNLRGLWGIELSMNEILKSKTGFLNHSVTSRGHKKEEFSSDEYKEISGQDVFLTIDLEYQKVLEEELMAQLKKTNSKSANGVIVNPYSGEIIALASVPGHDLNQKLSHGDEEKTRDYSTYYSYEPGSTLKPFSILAGLTGDKINLESKYYCEEGKYIVPNLSKKRVVVDHAPGFDTLSVKEILAESSNIGVVKLSSEIGERDIYKTFKKFGFGGKTGLKNYIESSGELVNIDKWDKHSLIAIPIGQGLSATNLQVAMAYSAIANGGYLLEPKIIMSSEKKVSVVRQVASQKDLDALVEALKMTVSEGTASSLHKEDFCSYGKTGTAQVFDKNIGRYSDSIFISSYAGVFPCEKPKLVCVISFLEPDEDMKYASEAAVPAMEKILDRILIKDQDLFKIADESK